MDPSKDSSASSSSPQSRLVIRLRDPPGVFWRPVIQQGAGNLAGDSSASQTNRSPNREAVVQENAELVEPPSGGTAQTAAQQAAGNLAGDSNASQTEGSSDRGAVAQENPEPVEDKGKAFAGASEKPKDKGKAVIDASEQYEEEAWNDGTSMLQLITEEPSMRVPETFTSTFLRSRNEKASSSSASSSRIDASPENVFILWKGGWDYIAEYEAEELLKPLKEPGNSYRRVSLANRSFGLEAALVALPILASLKNQLEEVDLSGIIHARPREEALEVLRVFAIALEGSALKSLNLSHNPLGEKGLTAVGPLLKSQTHLEELYLVKNEISVEAVPVLFELISHMEKLRIFHIYDNICGDVGAFVISVVVKQSPSLEDFRCAATNIQFGGAITLCQALEKSELLKRLDLCDNMFGVLGGLALSKAISNHGALTELYLSCLDLEDRGVVAIVDALKDTAPSLEVLEMAANNISDGATPYIAACVVKKPKLTNFNVACNEIGNEGAVQLGMALSSRYQLTHADFSSNLIQAEGARTIAKLVAHIPNLQRLNLDGNIIAEEVFDQLKNILETYANPPPPPPPPAATPPALKDDKDGADDKGQGS